MNNHKKVDSTQRKNKKRDDKIENNETHVVAGNPWTTSPDEYSLE